MLPRADAILRNLCGCPRDSEASRQLMTITMEIPAEWLAEAGLQNFEPGRSAIRCAVPHELIALDETEPFVRLVPIDANGFRRSKMMPVLEMIRDDRPCEKPIYVARQAGQWPYFLRDGVHRYYASRRLGFTYVPAEVIDVTY
jgi:hypothetical protein